MVTLQSFDAFPKTHEHYQSAGKPNVFKYAVFVFLTFFLYLETTSWMNPTPTYHFEVDKGINDRFQINMEIYSRNKCSDISVFIKDVSDDNLMVNELVKMEPFMNNDVEWCQIAGIFQTNKVKGRLTIKGQQRFGQQFDATHAINELSFGDFYPEVLNPLDSTSREVEQGVMVSYFLSIVPTTYRALGFHVDTYQYSAKSKEQTTLGRFQPVQVTFDYDFDPIKVDIKDDRMSFMQWAVRVINIGGGVWFAFRLCLAWGDKGESEDTLLKT